MHVKLLIQNINHSSRSTETIEGKCFHTYSLSLLLFENNDDHNHH